MSNKFSIFNFQFSISIGFLIIGILLTTYVFAADATPSAIPQDQVKEKIKERLGEVVSEGLEKVKGAMEQKKPIKYYALVGIIKAINDSQLSVTTPTGDKQVMVASNAAIIKVITGKEKTNLKIDQLEIDQYLIAMGIKNDNQLLGKRLIITTPPGPAILKKVISGKVTEIDSKKLVVKTNNGELSLSTDDKTKIKIVGLTKSTLDKIQIGDNLTAIVTLDKENNIDLVKVILVIPGKANPAAKENEIEATPSSSPKKTNESSPKASSSAL